MNYEALLRRYIEHVANSEGTHFIDANMQHAGFSDEEAAELEKMGREVYASMNEQFKKRNAHLPHPVGEAYGDKL